MACDVLPVAMFVLHHKSTSGLLKFVVLFSGGCLQTTPEKGEEEEGRDEWQEAS